MGKNINPPKWTGELLEKDLQEELKEDQISHANFYEQKIRVDRIRGTEFNECKFTKVVTKVQGCSFYNVRFIDVVFENCDFSNSSFELCSFIRCQFKNCKFLGINIFQSSLQHCILTSVLRYANFADNKMKWISFEHSILEEARFLENKFSHVYFENCSMNRIEWVKCDLKGIDLSSDEFDDIKVNPTELKGLILNSYQACIIARKLGIVIEG